MRIIFNYLRRFVLTLFGVAGLVFVVIQDSAADAIEELGNGAYLYLNGQHRSLFIVSDAGVIVTDPINEKVAVAYRAAIASITDQPVRFVVYSHYHWDRVSGAAVFKQESAQIVAQKRCAERFRENPNPAVIAPDLTFTDSYTVTLGNRALELYYFGPSHGDCLTVFVAQPSNIMQITDVINPPGAAFPPDPLVPYIRPHNIQQFFAATAGLIDRLGIDEVAASAVFPAGDDATPISPPLAPASIVREQAKFWRLIDATVKRAAAERRVGIDGFVRLRDDEFAAFESYPGYRKEDLPLILRRFIGFHDMGR
ncbi:MAG: MBL fold metallo-hydrolase [Gammaproteobacteria bacterium]|nr:hypothetical protein [Chromatiales bacterium]MDP6673653.1 MBL fold metallo-hydrolase [Gammaproteobacteria bacterium]